LKKSRRKVGGEPSKKRYSKKKTEPSVEECVYGGGNPERGEGILLRNSGKVVEETMISQMAGKQYLGKKSSFKSGQVFRLRELGGLERMGKARGGRNKLEKMKPGGGDEGSGPAGYGKKKSGKKLAILLRTEKELSLGEEERRWEARQKKTLSREGGGAPGSRL